MTTTERKDSWTPENDEILANTVLEHIRNGSTQLKAFEEAGEKLDRTAAACGFRWNAEVRKQSEQKIVQAKQERLPNNKKPVSERININRLLEAENVRNHPLFAAIKVIDRFITSNVGNEPRAYDPKIDELTAEIEEKNREIESLKRQLAEAKEAEITVTEDYKMLLQILERARSLGVLKGAEEDSKAAFRMDANGNLERIG